MFKNTPTGGNGWRERWNEVGWSWLLSKLSVAGMGAHYSVVSAFVCIYISLIKCAKHFSEITKLMGSFNAIQFYFLSWEEREELNKRGRKGHCWKKTPKSSSRFRTGWSQGIERISLALNTWEGSLTSRNARE